MLLSLSLLATTACVSAASFTATMQDSSMEPTFLARTRVRFTAAVEPGRGDVIAFEYPFVYPGRPRRELIGRVTGLPDDEVKLGPNGVSINGQAVSEPYAKNREQMVPSTVRVPRGMYFVMGDDRANQRDSRWWGPLPAGKLLGVISERRLSPASALALRPSVGGRAPYRFLRRSCEGRSSA